MAEGQGGVAAGTGEHLSADRTQRGCMLVAPLAWGSRPRRISVAGLLAGMLSQKYICLLKTETEKGTFWPDLRVTTKLHVQENKAVTGACVER